MFLCISVTVGHETVMGKVTFFAEQSRESQGFDFKEDYLFLDELLNTKSRVSLSVNLYLVQVELT